MRNLPTRFSIMPKLLRCCVVFALSFASVSYGASSQRSSTFVGNGGNAQDIDLAATLAVINLLSSDIDGTSKGLCECSDEWSENDLCRLLRQLSAEEKSVCKQMLISHSRALSALSDRKSPVSFSWSDSPLSVRTSQNKSRSVDAITQSDRQSMIIYRKRFFEMPQSYRVALMTHELFHMIKLNGQFISDDEPMPPFKTGRQMLDSLGAAIAMEANEQNVFREFRELNLVSRSHKTHWVSLDFHRVTHPESTSHKLLKSRESGGSGLIYTWRPDALALELGFDSVFHDSKFKDDIDVKETLGVYSFGVNYRLFPVNRYLSRWNQSFVTFGGSFLIGGADYKAKDRAVEMKDSARVVGGQSKIEIYLPVEKGFWVTSALRIRHVRYEYMDLRIKTIENQSIVSLGGAYGF